VDQEHFVTLEDVADRLGMSAQTVRRWVKTGRLRAYQPVREYRIDPKDLEAFLEARSTPKAEAPPRPASPRGEEAETGLRFDHLEDAYHRHAEQARRVGELTPEHARTLVEAAFGMLMEVRRFYSATREGALLDERYSRLLLSLLDVLPSDDSNVIGLRELLARRESA
jgi:excisionase family DNA binding protein